jgi:hypothetical protein
MPDLALCVYCPSCTQEAFATSTSVQLQDFFGQSHTRYVWVCVIESENKIDCILYFPVMAYHAKIVKALSSKHRCHSIDMSSLDISTVASSLY